MQYDQKQFTQKGLDMFSTALSNKQSITVDKVIVDDLPTNNFSNLGLLSLDSFADAMSFQANYTETSNNTLTVDAVMSNKGFQSPYTVQEIGLVGHVSDDTNGQSLMAVLVASDPFTLPAQQNDETPSQFIPNVTIQLANNDMGQVPVLVQDDAYIAQKDLDKLVANNGYIKLVDADNRYVKQTDFNNEVNGAVNEKADKSDLNSLQNNINNDVQPQLNQKANQSDLNTTNSNVSSLQSNKADKGDVTGQINQTLSQATAHSDQNLSTANNHSDSNYNDLSNKNNILSQRLEDYQKPNLAPYTEIDIWNTFGWSGQLISNHGLFYINVEQGKTYCFSFVSQSNNANYMSSPWQIGGFAIHITGNISEGNTGYFKWTADRSGSMPIGFNQDGSNGYVKNVCVTETSDFIPFSIAQQNKASIESEGQLTDDYQAPNLVDDTDNWIELPSNNYSINQGTFTLEAGKSYWFSIEYNYDLSQKVDNSMLIWLSGSAKSTGLSFNPTWPNPQLKQSMQYTPSQNETVTLYVQRYGNTSNYGGFRHLTVTQSDSYVPYEVAKRNRLWNQRIVNKTNDLSNTMNQQFSQANAHTDDVANSKQDKANIGTVENGYNLDGFTWYANLALNRVNLSTLGANLGLDMNYTEFWGYLAVRPNYNAVYQYLYDNLGNRWYRTTGRAWHQTATQDDIASIKANAWRELKVDGADGIILCKVDWSSNTAQLYGGISENSNTGNIIIHASDDFRFNDAGNVMQMRFNQKGTVSINSDGNIVWNNINMYNASLLFSGSTSLSYFDSSGVFDTTYTQGYGIIRCSISPK